MSILDIRVDCLSEIKQIIVNDTLVLEPYKARKSVFLTDNESEVTFEFNLEDIKNLKKALDKAVELWEIK